MYERLRATTFLPSRKSAETFCSSNLYISDTVNGSDSSDRALATPALWPPKPVYGLWILSFVYYFSEYVFASVMQLKRVVIYEHNFIYPVVTSCEYCPACNPPPRPCEYCPAKQLSDSDSSKKSRRKKSPLSRALSMLVVAYFFLPLVAAWSWFVIAVINRPSVARSDSAVRN